MEKQETSLAGSFSAVQTAYGIIKYGACELESHTSEANFGQSSIKKKRLADSEVILEDTKVQLEADEELFMETKSACRKKAGN